ncbi:MAG TPA: Lrp/AsnC family transcriptional regulator [Candidatus Nanoarchaeia archaeon]|nr:Lrp/AsnC family transcriptional regulator [Candidatus Nanoarchaeia archaeon]
MELEDTDKKILNILIDDSRLSLRQIAKKVDVSVATVMHHLNDMEENKIINRYTSNLNYEKIGYDIEVMIEVRISKGKLIEVEKKIATNPNVFAVYDVTGAFDAVILARFKSTRQMDSFLKKIQTYEFVERTETKFILRTMKDERMKVE